MAWLKKLIDKPTYIMIAGVWTAASVFLTQSLGTNIPLTTFVVTAGNLVIAWIGIESTSEHNEELKASKAEQQTANS